MTAKVIAYSSDPEALMLSLKIECLECDDEWGWSGDTKVNNDLLELWTKNHNEMEHNDAE